MVGVSLKVLAGLVRFFAWFFAVVTVLVACAAFVSSMSDPDAHNTMMSSGDRDAWALTYQGRDAALVALAEAIVVGSALWASRARRIAYRYVGHLILILWTVLWTANAFYVFGDGTFGVIYIVPFFCLCTCLRAVLSLRRDRPPVGTLPVTSA